MYMFRLSIGVTVEIPRNVEFDSLMNYWRKKMRLGERANFSFSLFLETVPFSGRGEKEILYKRCKISEIRYACLKRGDLSCRENTFLTKRE